MTLTTLMQAGPARANELFARLSETSDMALKTRERLFGELKAELEQHIALEEQHLFPILRRQPETKDLVAAAIRDNKDLRGKLEELEGLPKNDASFLTRLAELQKAFRQHARDEKRELLPAVQKALSGDQVQAIVEKMEGSLAGADQGRQDQAEERRAVARREREQREQAEAEARRAAEAEQERQEEARRAEAAARKASRAAAQSAERLVEAATEEVREVAAGAQDVAWRSVEAVGETAERAVAVAAQAPRTGLFLWDMMLGMSTPRPDAGASASRAVATRPAEAPQSREARLNEEVIPLAEEVLVVGKRTVETGTTRIRRYVVETPVEQQVSLVRERVVVERRRPTTNQVTGETLTEITVEVTETDEVPVVAKSVQIREEIVVRTERTAHVETVRDTVRQDEVEIEQSNARRPARARA